MEGMTLPGGFDSSINRAFRNVVGRQRDEMST